MRFDFDSSKYEKVSRMQEEVGLKLINSIRIEHNTHLLDIGCGSGSLTLRMAKIIDEGRVVGIDSSVSMIKRAMEKADELGVKNVEFVAMDASDMYFEDQFDVVFSNSALHWFKDGRRILMLMRNALRTGGTLAVQFPILNKQHPLVYMVGAAIEVTKTGDHYRNWEFPWFVPTLKGYMKMLAKVGFANPKVEIVENSFKFHSAQNVLDFFDSVGLDLYLEPLPDEKKVSVKDELARKLRNKEASRDLTFQFQRMFVIASG